MPPLKVLIAIELEEQQLKRLASVHPDVELMYATDAIFPYERRLGRPSNAAPPAPVDPEEALREAEVMLAFLFPSRIADRAPKLKWIQLSFAGADGYVGRPIWQSNITLTTAGGVAAIPIAEWVLAAILSFNKGIHSAQLDRRERLWRRGPSRELTAKTLGIIGLGYIGSELARMAKALGMRVIATRRSAVSGPLPENVDELYPREKLLALLAASDFVSISTPLTAETTRLISEIELKAMKPSAYLFNTSRGAVVDEAALVRALKEGWIAGAGLDVFEKEPLPPESELWDLPNLLMTPHLSGSSEFYDDRLTDLFAENLRRYLAGEKLLNVIDRSRGY